MAPKRNRQTAFSPEPIPVTTRPTIGSRKAYGDKPYPTWQRFIYGSEDEGSEGGLTSSGDDHANIGAGDDSEDGGVPLCIGKDQQYDAPASEQPASEQPVHNTSTTGKARKKKQRKNGRFGEQKCLARTLKKMKIEDARADQEDYSEESGSEGEGCPAMPLTQKEKQQSVYDKKVASAHILDIFLGEDRFRNWQHSSKLQLERILVEVRSRIFTVTSPILQGRTCDGRRLTYDPNATNITSIRARLWVVLHDQRAQPARTKEAQLTRLLNSLVSWNPTAFPELTTTHPTHCTAPSPGCYASQLDAHPETLRLLLARHHTNIVPSLVASVRNTITAESPDSPLLFASASQLEAHLKTLNYPHDPSKKKSNPQRKQRQLLKFYNKYQLSDPKGFAAQFQHRVRKAGKRGDAALLADLLDHGLHAFRFNHANKLRLYRKFEQPAGVADGFTFELPMRSKA